MTPETRARRGTKRHCQSQQCALPFYDLGRTAIICPYCASGFIVPTIEPLKARSRTRRSFATFARAAPLPAPVLAHDVSTKEPTTIADSGEEAILEVDVDDDEPLVLDDAQTDET